IFAEAANDLGHQPALGDKSLADTQQVRLEVCNNLLCAPAATVIVPDDRMEEVAPVGALGRAISDNLFDLVDRVGQAGTAAVAARDRRGRDRGPAPLRPGDSAIEQPVDIAERAALAQ